MSRTSLFRPRRHRAVSHRPVTGTRLLPGPFPPTILQPNSHYKRCPKALRLRLRSDQSPSRPLHGRSPDISRHALSKGCCQVRAPLIRRKGFAPSGDASEHGVMSLPWAIVPPWASAPLPDSPVAALGEADPTSDGRESPLPFLRMVEHFWWSRPHRETISRLLHILSEVRGCRRAVTDVKPPLRRTPPFGTMAGHFWWRRLPHRDAIARLHHVPSEVRGCRRVVADVNRPQGRTTRIAAGVADIMRKRPGPSTPPTGEPVRQRRIIPSLLPSNELEAHVGLCFALPLPFPPSTELEGDVGVSTPTSPSVLISPSPLKALRERGIKGVRVPLRGRGVPPPTTLPIPHQPSEATHAQRRPPARRRRTQRKLQRFQARQKLPSHPGTRRHPCPRSPHPPPYTRRLPRSQVRISPRTLRLYGPPFPPLPSPHRPRHAETPPYR